MIVADIISVICRPELLNVGKWSILPGQRSTEKSESLRWYMTVASGTWQRLHWYMTVTVLLIMVRKCLLAVALGVLQLLFTVMLPNPPAAILE